MNAVSRVSLSTAASIELLGVGRGIDGVLGAGVNGSLSLALLSACLPGGSNC
jgi:hypothetical protein